MPKITSAHLLAVIALFVALSGGAYAAATITGSSVKNSSLTGADIKNSSVTSKDVKDNSLGSGDVKNGTLRARDFKRGELKAGPAGPAGPQGATGPQGAQGVPGAPGATNVVIRRSLKDITNDTGFFTTTAKCAAGETMTGGGWGLVEDGEDQISFPPADFRLLHAGPVTRDDDAAADGAKAGGFHVAIDEGLVPQTLVAYAYCARP